MLKRSPNISFPNMYAFPGGKIEEQDYMRHWEADHPNYKMCPPNDFTKKMTAVRETFEECNILLALQGHTGKKADT